MLLKISMSLIILLKYSKMELYFMKKDITISEKNILKSIHSIISSNSSISDIINEIFRNLQKIIPCDRLDIALVEENGRRIEICCSAAQYQPLYLNKGYIEDIEDKSSLIRNAFLSKRHYIINNLNIYKNKKEKSELARLLLKEGILSFIIMPISSKDTVKGILFCGAKKNDSYSEHHARIFQETANELTHIIEIIYQQVLLEQNHQAYMEMLSFVSHELRSPISSIITLARTMADGYYGKMEESQRDILKRVIKKAEYLDAVSNQYLNLSRFESNVINLRPNLIDFSEDIIESAVELLMPQIEEHQMKLEREYMDTVFPVLCDPDMIRIVMMNLINNGIKYGNKNGIIRISLAKAYKKFSISVWNEGPGFSEEGKRHLFRKFSRLETRELIERKGSGIGLYLSWKIIQLHGGRISAESKQGAWAKFTVELTQYMDFCIVE